MSTRELRRAYAVLGLSPPVTLPVLRSQYKQLVKRWHPDRYQEDPAARKEATEKLRDINVAYRLVEASLVSPLPPDGEPSERQQSDPRRFTSHDYVDEIVGSLNRFNEWSLLPRMSFNRWLSLGAIAIYSIIFSLLLPAYAVNFPGIGSAVGRASLYFVLPLVFIWGSDIESNPGRIIARTIGWALMALPGFVALVWAWG